LLLDAVQADFLAKVVKVDASKYASVWAKKGFREGINPPPVRSADLEVIAAVKNTPGAVGYVSKPVPDLKLIQKF
jgi:ABC-type phosphate transport system substrate-binding protein